MHCNDDVLNFNTQGSTQWDGFRHYAYHDYPSKGEYTFYNGLTREEAKDKTIHKLGIQSMSFIVPPLPLLRSAPLVSNPSASPSRFLQCRPVYACCYLLFLS